MQHKIFFVDCFLKKQNEVHCCFIKTFYTTQNIICCSFFQQDQLHYYSIKKLIYQRNVSFGFIFLHKIEQVHNCH